MHYGTCSTAAATAAKVVACTGFKLVTGARIIVKFAVTNTADNPTLNVNSSGAKAIQYRGAAINAGYLAANRTLAFVYDGSAYQLIGDLDTNTVYTHPTSAGNKHIPAGGAAGQILRWSADGTAMWGADNNTTYTAFKAATHQRQEELALYRRLLRVSKVSIFAATVHGRHRQIQLTAT